MAKEFVSLAAQLRAAKSANRTPAEAPPRSAQSGEAAPEERSASCEFVVEELAVLRLAALEAFDRARGRMLELLARDVLARELMLAPADVDALAARALRVFADEEPLALVVSPADAERVASPFPVRIDPTLVAGDLVIAVRDGEIDARFALRLGAVLAASRA